MKTVGKLTVIGAVASVFMLVTQAVADDDDDATDEAAGQIYMDNLNEEMAKWYYNYTLADWNYETNITDYNEEIETEISLELSQVEKENWNKTEQYPWEDYEDENLKRLFKKFSYLGTSALPDEDNQELTDAINNMTSIYATATICDYYNSTKCDLYIDPDIENIFATSRNPDELKDVWLQWYTFAGAPCRGNFTEYVELDNEAAQLNGYDNVAELWLGQYEDSDIEDQLIELWSQVKPLYLQIHAYVRRLLRLKYGEDVVSCKGPIPAHLLGNVWAQTWENVEDFTTPYPDVAATDVTAALVEQNYTALKMFQVSEEFFVSMNLSAMTDLFWEYSIIEKPTDGRDLLCQPVAWNFFNDDDFRIVQCTEITGDYFINSHHMMGLIEYYMQYRDQPFMYRDGANPAFQDAVGNVVGLSVSTPKHLHAIGLLEEGTDDDESNINQLYRTSLEQVVLLPFAYLLDIYRYGIFRGYTTSDDYNCHFWTLREELQGVEPPANRSEEDFDAAAKYHVVADIEYMHYYVSNIIQFQFHRALCVLAGEFSDDDSDNLLSNCDISNSTVAGNAFAEMLQMGASKPWPDAMEVLTGARNMSASGLLEYFQPLYDWLKEENENNGEYIGWESSSIQFCTDEQKENMVDSDFRKQLDMYAGN